MEVELNNIEATSAMLPVENEALQVKEEDKKAQEVAQTVIENKAEEVAPQVIAQETVAPAAQVAAQKTTEVAQQAAPQAPVQTTAKAQETAQAAKKVEQKVATQVAAPAKKADVKLVKISRDDLKKLDATLVKKHIPSETKDIKWNAARNVVVIEKNGKERAYKIGNGAAPALIESKKHADIVNFLAAKVAVQPQVAPATKALPAVKLVKISRDDLKKKDANLVKKHVPSNVKNIKWDAARNVVVIEKSGKERAYKIGSGAAPALIESKKHADIINKLNKM
jgi:hypothetical protein